MVSELLPEPCGRLVWGAVAVLLAVVLGRLPKWYVHRLEERPPDGERELAKLRRRETAIVLFATAIPCVTLIVVLVVIADYFIPLGAAALGGTAFVTIIIGFAAQRFLRILGVSEVLAEASIAL
jgi:small-conductance mechanosensitive channel